jgi:hypothetical protein
MGVFATIITELAAQAQDTEILMIVATHAKAHRTASSLAVQKGGRASDRAHKRRIELKSTCPSGSEGSPDLDVSLDKPDLGLRRCAGSSALDPTCNCTAW